MKLILFVLAALPLLAQNYHKTEATLNKIM